MEIIELTKEIFEGRQVRILGTIEEPLFVADDIGKVLDIGNIRKTTKDYDNTEKITDTIKILPVTNGNGESYTREMSLLTEKGLYKVLFTSRKKEAKKFQDWVFKVIKEIRLRGRYDLREDIDRQKLEALENENKELKRRTVNLPPIIYHQIDINEFIDKSVIYLLHITEYDYKFGVTGDIEKRIATHKSDFKKLGFDINIVKLWKCESANIMSSIEKMIKNIAGQNNMLVKKYEKTEIINTGDISIIVDKIDDYVSDKNIIDSRYFELESKRLEIESKRADKEIIDAQNEQFRLKIKMKELKLAAKKYKDNVNPAYVISGKHLITDKLLDTVTDNTFTDYDNVYHSDEDIPDFNIDAEIVPTTPVPPIKEDKTSKTKDWIASNPPQNRELTTVYYKRYVDSLKSDKLPNNIFGKLVRESGYKVVQNTLGRQWSK
ncbi:hypothetical protein PV-S19_0236 [Pacmanvirus S19]|nr:hypothetical protein PV-S19_0236 [Pacmanvirus S19]